MLNQPVRVLCILKISSNSDHNQELKCKVKGVENRRGDHQRAIQKTTSITTKTKSQTIKMRLPENKLKKKIPRT